MGRHEDSSLPLCVDLDGTLVRTDTLIEYLLKAVRDWRVLLAIPLWLVRGKAFLKDKLAERIELDVALLPYNTEFIHYLEQQRARGRPMSLVTASNVRIGEAVNAHLELFDEVIASTKEHNVRGREKALVLIERFGERNFVYAGNDHTDIAVWKVAAGAIAVSTPEAVTRWLDGHSSVERRFPGSTGSRRALVKALRPYQWVKNTLIFVPIITANAVDDGAAWFDATLVFMAFSLMASGVYVLNDLLDLEADRKHPRKRNRPFASGVLSLKLGLGTVPVLFVLGGAVASQSGVLPILVGYALISVSYSIYFKNFPLVDVFILTTLYTIRLYAGGITTGYHISLWLLAFSCFLFLSLAIIKRVSELKTLPATNMSLSARGYSTDDVQILQSIGLGATFASSVVLTLYIQSDYVAGAYSDAATLWWVIPVTLFWQCRLWLATARGYMDDDPIVYAAKDWVSRLSAIVVVGIVVGAYFDF